MGARKKWSCPPQPRQVALLLLLLLLLVLVLVLLVLLMLVVLSSGRRTNDGESPSVDSMISPKTSVESLAETVGERV